MISEHGKGNAHRHPRDHARERQELRADRHRGRQGDARAAEGERLRALHHRARAGLGRLSRKPRACRSRRAAQRLSHLPMGGARCIRLIPLPRERPAGSAAARALTICARPNRRSIARAMSRSLQPLAAARRQPRRHGDCSARSRGARSASARGSPSSSPSSSRLSSWRDTAAPGSADMQQDGERRLPAGVRHDRGGARLDRRVGRRGASAQMARARLSRARSAAPRRGAFGIACLAALLIALRSVHATGSDAMSCPASCVEAYKSARASPARWCFSSSPS